MVGLLLKFEIKLCCSLGVYMNLRKLGDVLVGDWMSFDEFGTEIIAVP